MKTILAIDDQADNLITIKAIIHSYLSEFQVITSTTGSEGIKMAREQQPATIFIDIIMPEMDGFEVCRRLKSDVLTKHIPVIMISASITDTESRIKALETGADAFVVKPIDPAELMAQLKVMLRIKHSEDQLRNEKISIEQIVQARTTELLLANKKLEQEIEERKQTEQKLSESQIRQGSILHTAMDGFMLTDLKGRLIEVNETYCRMTGYTTGELLSMSITDLYATETFETTKAHIHKVVATGKDRFESKHRRKDGSIFDVEVSVLYQLSENDRILSFINDITDRKQVESEMMKSRERASMQRNSISRLAVDEVISQGDLAKSFHRLTEEIAVAMVVERAGIWLFSDDQKSLHCNSLFDLKTKNHIPGSLLNCTDFPRYFEAIQKESRVNANDAQNDPRTCEFTEQYLIPLGITSMLDAGIYMDGKLMGVVCFEHTGEKRTWFADEESFASTIASLVAQALLNNKRKQAENMLQNIIEQNPISIQILDADGLTIKVNPAHTLLFNAVPPPGFSIFDDLKTKMKGFEKMISLVKSGKVVHLPDIPYNVHDIFPDFPDSPVWIKATIFPLQESNGKPERFVMMHEDVTKRKQFENEILQLNKELDMRVRQRTAELEEVNKELETFSYSISHDLLAPLRRIKGFINLFLEGKTSHFTKEDKEYLTLISYSALEMEKLIDAILSFSRLKSFELRKTTIKSYDMVQQIIEFFGSEIANRKIKFNVETLPPVRGDAELIRQVWINLISNAIKYTSKKELAVIEIGALSTGTETTFFVKDNGAGFNMKYADKLFGVFQRLHKTRDFEGVGIGLANVNRIISRHGGTCRAEGDIDQGATFYFSLPK
jgi:PAS domain S-box-containing protein